MDKSFPPIMKKLVKELAKMPGIGPVSAERLAFYIIKAGEDDVKHLLYSIHEAKKKIRFCSLCNNLSEEERCHICTDSSRANNRVCVVDSPAGVLAMERSGAYRGVYHVLLGHISPIDGIGPEDIKIQELIDRVKEGGISEIIIATDFTTEGETTALYLNDILKNKNIKVTRLARGVPAGAILEFADAQTLERAFEDRTDV